MLIARLSLHIAVQNRSFYICAIPIPVTLNPIPISLVAQKQGILYARL